jgi:hypothetical protein
MRNWLYPDTAKTMTSKNAGASGAALRLTQRLPAEVKMRSILRRLALSSSDYPGGGL